MPTREPPFTVSGYQFPQRMNLFENFLPGVQEPPPTEDDGVAPSSLDQSRDSDPTASMGYSGGGIY